MKPAEMAIIGILGMLLWSEWQDWQRNQADSITLAYKELPPSACGNAAS